MQSDDEKTENQQLAKRWCNAQGPGWSVASSAGSGGTAEVFTVHSPQGDLALKLINQNFSTGDRGTETEKRIAQQLRIIGAHSCPHLVKILGIIPLKQVFWVF